MGIRTVSCLRKADWTTDVLSLGQNVLEKVVCVLKGTDDGLGSSVFPRLMLLLC